MLTESILTILSLPPLILPSQGGGGCGVSGWTPVKSSISQLKIISSPRRLILMKTSLKYSTSFLSKNLQKTKIKTMKAPLAQYITYCHIVERRCTKYGRTRSNTIQVARIIILLDSKDTRIFRCPNITTEILVHTIVTLKAITAPYIPSRGIICQFNKKPKSVKKATTDAVT